MVHFEVKSIEAISCVLICFPCSGGGGGGITHTGDRRAQYFVYRSAGEMNREAPLKAFNNAIKP
jgi:hypothetical protein